MSSKNATPAPKQSKDVDSSQDKTLPLVEFARNHMGIELNAAQIEMLEYAAEGKTLIRARSHGRHTARLVAQAWLKYGLTGVNDLVATDGEVK